VNFCISLMAGLVVMSLNLAGLAFLTSRLGRGAKASAYAAYAGLWFLKLLVLGVAIFLLVKSPFFQFAGLFIGLGIPVAGLAIWQMAHLGKNK
jgi:hypothetical protein